MVESDEDLQAFLRGTVTPSNPVQEDDAELSAYLRGSDPGPPGGYATEEEVRERRLMGEARTRRGKVMSAGIKATGEALTNIATYPGRLAEEARQKGPVGTLRSVVRGAAEEASATADLAATGAAYLSAKGPTFESYKADAQKRMEEGIPSRFAAGVRRGAEMIEPYEGTPAQILGRGVALAGESAAVAPIAAKITSQIPLVRRPFELSKKQWERAPFTAALEETAAGVGSTEALKDVQPETLAGQALTSTIGGGTYVGATGLLRGIGRQTVRGLARFAPESIAQYRDVLPTHLREKPYRLATRQVRYAIAGEAPTPERRAAIESVISRIEDAERMGIEPTLGAVGGRAGLTHSEKLILQHEPGLHTRIQDRRTLGQQKLLGQYQELVPAPNPTAFNDYMTKRVEDTLQQVEDVITVSRRGGGPLDTITLADNLTSHGGIVTDMSPRTGQVFIDSNSTLGREFADAALKGQDRIQRAGNIFEFQVTPGDPTRFIVRGHSLPSATDSGTANAVLGHALQEAHDGIFGEIWLAYDDIAKQAGPRKLYAPKINKAIREAYFKGGPVQPEFLPPEWQELYKRTSDRNSPEFNSYTLRDITSMERRLDTMLSSSTNDQQIEALTRMQSALDETLNDIATSRRKDMADFRPLGQELQQVNNARRAAVNTWRSGLASVSQGQDPSDTFKYVLKPDVNPGSIEVRQRLAQALQERPDIVPLVEDSIVEQAFAESSEALKDGTRTFNAKKLDKFKTKYAQSLQQVPGAAARLDNVLEAQRRVDELGLPKSMTGKRAAVGTLASFMDDPAREIDNIMVKPPGERMREVGRWMARFQGDQDAIQAFRYRMWDALVARSAKADVSLVAGNYSYLNPQRTLETIDSNRPMLVQLYGADHVARMEKMTDMSSIMQRMASDQHVSLEEESALAAAAGSWFMTAIAQIYGPTQKAMRIGRTGYRLSKAIDNKQSRELLAEWYANPSSSKFMLAKLSRENEPAMIRSMAAATHLPWLKDLATDDELTNRRIAR